MLMHSLFRYVDFNMNKTRVQRKIEYKVNPLMGSYKLGAGVLLKMISAASVHNGRYAGASRYEILAMIHLTHIADAEGRVECFRAREFMEAVGCSRREAFSLMRSLEDKGYIDIRPSSWYHCYELLILHNDYRIVTEKSRYLNTNHEFFEPGRCLYDDLIQLSHTSLRLLLFLLFNYSQSYGYHASYTGIMAALGIKHKDVINRCLDELDPILSIDGTFYRIREDLKRGTRYGFLDIAPYHKFFEFSDGIDRGKDSYFKRHVRLIVREAGCAISGAVKTVDGLLTDAFALFQSLLDRDITPAAIYKTLSDVLISDGVFDELALYHISRTFT